MRVSMTLVALVPWLLAIGVGCGGAEESDGDADTDTDVDSDTDADSDSDGDLDAGPACDRMIECGLEDAEERDDCVTFLGCRANELWRADFGAAWLACIASAECDPDVQMACMTDALDATTPSDDGAAFAESCRQLRGTCPQFDCDMAVGYQDHVLAGLDQCFDIPSCEDWDLCIIEHTICEYCDLCIGG